MKSTQIRSVKEISQNRIGKGVESTGQPVLNRSHMNIFEKKIFFLLLCKNLITDGFLKNSLF